MSLIACPECTKSCSDRAPQCPHCGYPIARVQQAIPSSVAPTVQAAPAVIGAPTPIPVEPKALPIAIGLALLGLAIWMMTSWLPAHKPMDEAEQLLYAGRCLSQGQNCLGHWMFNPKLYPWMYVIASLIGLAGINQVIRGATYRPLREVMCSTCRRRVVGKKVAFGVLCPNGHAAQKDVARIVLVVLVVLIVVAGLALAGGAR